MANYFNEKLRKPLQNSIINLTIERLDSQGQGVGYYQKKPIFVMGVLPSEKVKVQLIEQRNKFSRAKLLTIIQTSSDRITPKCPHFGKCGGCDLQHLSQEGQLTFKQNKVIELFNRQQITHELPWQIPMIGKCWHYRRKARIGVQYDKKGQAIIGFRRRGSNLLQAIKVCPILTTDAATVFSDLKPVLAQLSQSKSIGHIEVISTETTEQTEQISLVIRQLTPINEQDRALWKLAAGQNQWQILLDDGKQVSALTIPQSLQFTVSKGVRLEFKSSDFIQINAGVNQKMISQAIQWLNLSHHDVVLDLFCGLGNFSLPIAQRVKQVVGVEGVDSMVERAINNASNNHCDNVTFFQTDLNDEWLDQNWTKQSFSKVILDPARDGALKAVEQLILLNIPTILYISCDPASLAVDVKLLLLAGYKIEKIAIMDMFTHTQHSETMVLFLL